MENQKNEPQKSEEINLGQFFDKVSEVIGGFGRSFTKGLARLRRTTLINWKTLILFAIAGGLIGYFYSKQLNKKYYESSMILDSKHLNKRTLDNAITKLNLLTGEENRTGLKRILNINDSVAKNIRHFEGKPFLDENDIIELQILKEQLKNSKLELENPKVIDEVIKRLEIENRHAFEIKVSLFNPAQFKMLEGALVNYLRNSDYVKKRIEITGKNLLARQKQLLGDQAKLDSLKRGINASYEALAKQQNGSNNVILKDGAVAASVDVYKESIKLYEEIDKTNEDVFLGSDFEVVDGFTELNVPKNLSTQETVIISLFIGLFCGYLVIGIIRLNKYLDKIA